MKPACESEYPIALIESTHLSIVVTHNLGHGGAGWQPLVTCATKGALELILQPELHHPRLRQQTRVLAKSPGIANVKTGAVDIEAHRIGHIKNLPAELQVVRFLVGHDKGLAQAHVELEVAVATDSVALADLAGETVIEGIPDGLWIGEDIRAAGTGDGGGVARGLRTGDGRHLRSETGVVPVSGPASRVRHAAGQSASHRIEATHLPATEERVRDLVHAAEESFAQSEGQLINAVTGERILNIVI